LCCFSTSVYCCCSFRYRLSPETFGYTLACVCVCVCVCISMSAKPFVWWASGPLNSSKHKCPLVARPVIAKWCFNDTFPVLRRDVYLQTVPQARPFSVSTNYQTAFNISHRIYRFMFILRIFHKTNPCLQAVRTAVSLSLIEFSFSVK